MKDDQHIGELAAKARDGDRDALEKLAAMFHEEIFRMVYYRTRSRMDAEDMAQEIFMQMMKSLKSLKDTEKFKSWLFRIAVNRVADFHRKKKILAFVGLAKDSEDLGHPNPATTAGPSDDLMKKEFFGRLNGLLTALSRWEREVFTLRFLDNLGIREIAETLNKNESTVKTHLYRALKKFRQHPECLELLKGDAS